VLIPIKPFDEWLARRTEQQANAIDKAVSEVLENFEAEED